MNKNQFYIKLFQGLNEAQIQKLYKSGKSITLKAGDILFSESNKATSLYIILSGTIFVRKIHKTIHQIYEVSTLSQDNTIGEVAEPRSATVIALTKTQLIEIPLASTKEDLQILSIVTQNISHTLSRRLRQIN